MRALFLALFLTACGPNSKTPTPPQPDKRCPPRMTDWGFWDRCPDTNINPDTGAPAFIKTSRPGPPW